MGKLDPGSGPVSPVSHECLIRPICASDDRGSRGGGICSWHAPPPPASAEIRQQNKPSLWMRRTDGYVTADQQERPASFADFVTAACLRKCFIALENKQTTNRPWKTWIPVWRHCATACTCTFNEATLLFPCSLGSTGAAAAISEAH